MFVAVDFQGVDVFWLMCLIGASLICLLDIRG
jgi:hypothetical protein